MLEFRGKLGGNGDSHPVLFHMMDTMNVAEHLLAGMAKPAREKLFGVFGNEEAQRKMICFISGLHDIGKVTPHFQAEKMGNRKDLERMGYSFGLPCREQGFHTKAGYRIIYDMLLSKNLSRNTSQSLAVIVGSHHGDLLLNYPPSNRYIGRGKWQEKRDDIFNFLLDEVGLVIDDFMNLDDTPFSTIAVFIGLVTVADWIASNERFFPYESKLSVVDYRDLSRQRSRKAIETLRFDDPVFSTDVPTPAKLLNVEQLRNLQVRFETDVYGDLIVVEAPTGEGKTEAALIGYANSSWDGMTNGLYVAMPTQATSNQMIGRVKEFLDRNSDKKQHVSLIHGNALFSNPLIEELMEADSELAEWMSVGKRAVLSRHGVGTVDQAFLAVLPTRHYFVRLFGLAGKMVIFDEVHAYDTFMNTILKHLLKWLRAIGSEVIMLSATLPVRTRKEIMKCYDTEVNINSYPLISMADRGEITIPIDPARERELTIKNTTYDTYTDLIDGWRGGCTAIIVNTVAKAQELYSFLKMRYPRKDIMLLHSRFLLGQKNSIEEKLIRTYGKGVRRPLDSIVVSTQIIEQSLDIDFDVMFSEYAPVDLLLQRAGRIYRHENRPRYPHDEPTLYLFEPEKEGTDFGVSSRIYETELLRRTYDTLNKRQSIRIPGDIREVIEEVYGSIDYNEGEIGNKERSQVFNASKNLIPEPDIDIFSTTGMTLFLDSDIESNAVFDVKTRDFQRTQRIICIIEREGELSFPIGDIIPTFSKRPTNDEAKTYLLNSVTINHGGIISLLEKQGIPSAWQRNRFTRHCTPVIFKNNRTQIGNYTLLLDEQVGIQYEKEN